MNEMIDEIKSLVQKNPKPELIMILDVLATMAQRIEAIENRLEDMKGASNGNKAKGQEGFNIG